MWYVGEWANVIRVETSKSILVDSLGGDSVVGNVNYPKL